MMMWATVDIVVVEDDYLGLEDNVSKMILKY
jgi:hypothetical protein